jgi:hypothetical protein
VRNKVTNCTPFNTSQEKEQFISEFFITASQSNTEMVLALAFMNFSYDHKNHEVSPSDDGMNVIVTLKDYDLLLYQKETKES